MKYKLYSKPSFLEIVYLVFIFAVYCFFALSFQAGTYGPDEAMRYDVPKFIYECGRLPFGWEEAIRNPYWGFSYGFGFYLPYAIGAFFMKLVSFFSVSEAALLTAARMTSVFSAVGVGYYAIQITHKVSYKPVRWVFIVIMTLLPQVTFLASYYNLDMFSLLCVTAIVFSWICCEETEWSNKTCIHLAVWLGLCFMSYEFAYSFIPGSVLLYLYHAVKNKEHFSFNAFISKGLLIFAIAFAICGWVFIRNAIIYDGDILAFDIRGKFGELYAVDYLKPSLRETFKRSGMSVIDMLIDSAWVNLTCRSFVSAMGYMSIFADDWVYSLYRLIITLTLLGIAFKLGSGELKSDRDTINIAFFAFISSLVTLGISVYYSWAVDYEPQGRYIITMLPLFAASVSFGMDGISEVFSSVFQNKNRKVTGVVVSAVICALIAATVIEGYLNCVAFFGSLS